VVLKRVTSAHTLKPSEHVVYYTEQSHLGALFDKLEVAGNCMYVYYCIQYKLKQDALMLITVC
jgi:hypothetical protein